MSMKKIVLAVAMASALTSVNAMAQNGTVTFEGSITDSPCSVTPDTLDQTVNMGDVSSESLKNGQAGTPTSFTINLTDCSTAVKKTVKTTWGGMASTANPDLLGLSGNAKGASLAIADGSGNLIALGQPSASQQLLDGNNTLQFSAYLQGDGASATIIPGNFTTVATFALTYQ
ncbi:type 1 fimbrial protein [Enterobacter ludwigii]|uniref:fimbrial protein n=1 Tax=Enterobacter ludwigii TaxID=299767 RepID=UPI00159C7C82|nr:fimbrial protein [Enterobacter ludwigii]QLA06944.1 type 1 fimbrial protein [Enterobacter ludwigii]